MRRRRIEEVQRYRHTEELKIKRWEAEKDGRIGGHCGKLLPHTH